MTGLAPFGPPDALLRELGRGKVLDVHMRENGLVTRLVLADGRARDLIQLAAKNQASPCILTVGIDVREVVPAEADAPGDVALQIGLEWGVGKGRSTAIVDARHGAQISVCANILNVQAIYPVPENEGGGGATTIWDVSASVVYGTRAGEANHALTFTDAAIVVLNAATSAPRAVPKYAVAVAWYSPDDPTVAAAPAASLIFVGRVGGVVVAETVTVAGQFVTVPNGTYFVLVRNLSTAGASQTFRLVYEICL